MITKLSSKDSIGNTWCIEAHLSRTLFQDLDVKIPHRVYVVDVLSELHLIEVFSTSIRGFNWGSSSESRVRAITILQHSALPVFCVFTVVQHTTVLTVHIVLSSSRYLPTVQKMLERCFVRDISPQEFLRCLLIIQRIPHGLLELDLRFAFETCPRRVSNRLNQAKSSEISRFSDFCRSLRSRNMVTWLRSVSSFRNNYAMRGMPIYITQWSHRLRLFLLVQIPNPQPNHYCAKPRLLLLSEQRSEHGVTIKPFLPSHIGMRNGTMPKLLGR